MTGWLRLTGPLTHPPLFTFLLICIFLTHGSSNLPTHPPTHPLLSRSPQTRWAASHTPSTASAAPPPPPPPPPLPSSPRQHGSPPLSPPTSRPHSPVVFSTQPQQPLPPTHPPLPQKEKEHFLPPSPPLPTHPPTSPSQPSPPSSAVSRTALWRRGSSFGIGCLEEEEVEMRVGGWKDGLRRCFCSARGGGGGGGGVGGGGRK